MWWWNCCLCWTAELVLAGLLGYLKLAHVRIVALIQAYSETKSLFWAQITAHLWAVPSLFALVLKLVRWASRFFLFSSYRSTPSTLCCLLASRLVQLVARAWPVLEKKEKKSPLKLNIKDHPILKYGWFLKLNGCVLHFKWCCLSHPIKAILSFKFWMVFLSLAAPLTLHLSSVITCQVLSFSEPQQISSATSPVVGPSVYGSGHELSWPADAGSSKKPGFWAAPLTATQVVASQLAKMATIAAIFQMLEILRPYNRASNHLWARSSSIKVSVLTQCSCKSTPAERDEKARMISLFSAKTCKHHTKREIKVKVGKS